MYLAKFVISYGCEMVAALSFTDGFATEVTIKTGVKTTDTKAKNVKLFILILL
jgi:hypothetical protein